MLFFAVVLSTIGLIHYYLWRRLVRDPLRPGWGRRIGTVLAVLLCVLAPLTLIGVRAGYFTWLSWPGYLWIAVMFYLLVTLAVLEIPRLLALRFWAGGGRDRGRSTTGSTATATATNGASTATRVDAIAGTGAGSGTGAGAEAGAGAANGVATGAGAGAEAGAGDGHGVTASLPSTAKVGGEHSGKAADSATADKPVRVEHSSKAADAAPGDEPARGEQFGKAAGLASGDKPAGGEATVSVAGDAVVDDEAAERRGIERRLLLARGTAIFAGLTAAGITGYGVKTATGAPRIDRSQMPMAKLPRAMDGTRIAVVSDIHIGPLTGVDHAERIVRVINSVNADLVCVVGDLVDGSVAELGRFAAPLGGIQSRHGAFFVTGNHEYYSGAEEWIREVDRLGLRPLRNERVAINGLDLAGVNDLTGEEQGDAPDFARALGDRDTSRPVVLMAHQPVAAREAAPYGVDLQVSGHTHGGQMAPFNMLVKLQQPVVSGFGKVDGVPVYVTNGAGYWGPPVRVGAPPQVTVIELRVA